MQARAAQLVYIYIYIYIVYILDVQSTVVPQSISEKTASFRFE